METHKAFQVEEKQCSRARIHKALFEGRLRCVVFRNQTSDLLAQKVAILELGAETHVSS